MQVNIYAAKTQLSRLVDQVNAGEEVVITRHGRPVARLVPADVRQPRTPGRRQALVESRTLQSRCRGKRVFNERSALLVTHQFA